MTDIAKDSLPQFVTETSKDRAPFDFEAHRRSAAEQFSRKRDLYENFAKTARDILADAIKSRGLRVNEIQFRAKELDSFGKKAMTPKDENPEQPKYKNPLTDITDLAAVRVITFFPRTVEDVCKCIQEEFDVIERVDHTATAQREERLGYQSIHYLVRLGENRKRLPEYRRFEGLVAEVQVRTVMQHAWAEIEHDIRYKSKLAIPTAISRRFMTLAGLLEIADREFQAIQEEDANLRTTARALVEQGRLTEVEVTPDAIREYLNRRLGADDRISDFTYEMTARHLRFLGFQNLGQLDECIATFKDDGDRVSRVVFGRRCGQVTRLELLLLASMGDNLIQNHPWSDSEYYRELLTNWLNKLRLGGMTVGSYMPKRVESSE